jgi:hypothetical protein
MRKFILMACGGLAIVLGAPQLGSAMPLAPAGLGAAADSVANTEQVHHRRWHHRHHHHWRGYRHHHHHHRYWR